MPRKDLSEERVAQILDSFEACILRFGIEGSSLEQVAEEAGMKRPIIRHYIGNREALITAMTDRFIERYRVQTSAMFEELGDENRLESLVEILFLDHAEPSSESVMIFEHLVLAGERNESIRKPLAKWTTDFIERVEGELRLAFPGEEDLESVAFGIVSIYFNYVSLQPLRLQAPIRQQSMRAVHRLIENLNRG